MSLTPASEFPTRGAGVHFSQALYDSLHSSDLTTGKTIILVADKMIGTGFIESEPDINKLIALHKQWWVLFVDDDIAPVFDRTGEFFC